jgi:ankyrin repeat protein
MTGNAMRNTVYVLMLCVAFAGFLTAGATPARADAEIPYLLTVAAKGDVATVRAILQSGASPNAKDADGITALMYAARKNQAAVAQLLLEKGA